MTIQQTCSKGILVPPMDSRVTLKVHNKLNEECHKPKSIESFGTVIRTGQMVIPVGCGHDVANALRIRILFERSEDSKTLSKVIENAKIELKCLGRFNLPMVTEDQWLNHLPSRRRRVMKEAQPIIDAESSTYNMFNKLEAYVGKVPGKHKPRLIFNPHPNRQKSTGLYFWRLGKAVSESLRKTNVVYDSGYMDASALGRLAERCAEKKFLLEIDVSNFDGSVARAFLIFETFIIEECASELPEEWEHLKATWLHRKASSKGVSYKGLWGRLSGDAWTSTFNSIINRAIVLFLFPDAIGAVKGDDGFFGTDMTVDIALIKEFYAKLGMTVKVKLVDIDTLGYCSGNFWPTPEGRKYGINPIKFFSKFGLNLNRQPEKVHKRLLLGTAISLLPIAKHVPLVGPFLDSLIENSNESPLFPENEFWKVTSNELSAVDVRAYNQASLLYGVDVDDILRQEMFLGTLTLKDLPLVLEDKFWSRAFTTYTELEVEEVDANWVKIVEKERRSVLDSVTYFMQIVIKIIFLAVLEEAVKHLFGNLLISLLIGTYESYHHGNYLNLILHCTFYLIGAFGWRAQLASHIGWNLFVMWMNTDHLKSGSALYLKRSRRPQLDILKQKPDESYYET